MSPASIEMTAVATDYCNLIEKAGAYNGNWLEELVSLLPRLHAAVTALGDAYDLDHSMTPDLDARFELFAVLREMLGKRDEYWMQYDVAQDGQCMSGSLADDLTDIYCELKHGLRLMMSEPAKALDDWRSGFHLHWGQHLLDAERHLYELKSKNQL
ncbi:MAG: DUF5063 domain-containing protein [Chromatiaceae bacterium]|nr:DUF5063 domain-containing protein [Chromatiaceae bacterium]